jgi:hypothetical protein
MTGGWRPVLVGDLAARARAVVDEIAEALDGERTWSIDPSLGDGQLGRALLFGYLARARREPRWSVRAIVVLNQVVERLNGQPIDESLFGGVAGVGWAIEHLGRHLGAPADDQDEDANEAIDHLLLQALEERPWPGEYDLLFGLAGLGVYALERTDRPGGRACLERVIEHLADTAEPQGSGLAWRSPPHRLSPEERIRSPQGYFDVGVAHGAPGVASVLAGACAAGVAVERARPLLDGVMRWLEGCRLPGDNPHAFPHRQHDLHRGAASRVAWCYGDPGVAAALHSVARAVDDQRLRDEALAIARRAAGQPPEGSGVLEAGLCHGAGGLAILFHRLWHDSDDPLFAEAARRWYAQVLELHTPGAGVGGVRSLSARVPEGEAAGLEWYWREDDGGFLTGAAGVALSLLAGLGGPEPRWDRLLALSVPGGPGAGPA